MDSENFNVKFGEVINTGGTTDFNSLTNRPKYNNAKMTGETNIPKVPTATSELTNDSGFITSAELGTETTAREQADNALQGQINTKADKSTTYTKTETDNLVNGAIGEVKVLTTEDYNWPADNPTGIAPWLLDLGWYTAEDDVKIFFNPTLSTTTNWHYGQSFYIGKGTGPGGTQYQMAKYMYRIGTYGVHPTEGYGAYTWITWFAKDNSGIQMAMFPSFADLSARVTRKAGAPTTSTEGVLGQLWEDSTGGDLYQLKSIDTSVTPNVYTWGQVGGSSVNVVQTTGTSTTDVMSQNAVTLALADKQDTLTAGSNITISDNTISAIDTTYTAGTNVSISASNEISATDTTYSAGTGLDLTGTVFSVDNTVALKTDIPTVNDATLTITQNGTSAGTFTANDADDTTIALTDTTYSDFIGTDGMAAGTAGLVPAPATTDAGKFLKADGTWDTAGGGGGPTVVQTTGTSTTDVMSQNAVTSMVFADPATMQKIKIGAGTSTNEGTHAVEIGEQSSALGNYSVALGYDSTIQSAATNAISIRGSVSKQNGIALSGGAHGRNAIAIGTSTYVDGENSIALGAGATTSTKGVISINTTNISSTAGYNSSQYRLLTGVYDGQSAHDAVNLGQIMPTTDSSAPTTATAGRLGEVRIDTSDTSAYMCVDTTGGTYTWKKITA